MTASTTIVSGLILSLLVSLCSSFPLSSLLSNSREYPAYAQDVFPYSGSDVLVEVYLSDDLEIFHLHPDVILPNPLGTYHSPLIARVNRKTLDVKWARLIDLPGSKEGCMSNSGHFYYVASGTAGNVSSYFINKYTPDGAIVWEKSFPNPISSTMVLNPTSMECVASNAIILKVKEGEIFHFISISTYTGKVKSTSSVELKPKSSIPNNGLDAVHGPTCIFSTVIAGTLYGEEAKFLHITCIYSNGSLSVRKRKLGVISSRSSDARLAVAPKEEWAKCQPVYVMYYSVFYGLPNREEPNPKQVIIRKLCVDTLKDTPWAPGGLPHPRYLSVPVERGVINMYHFLAVPKYGGVAAVFHTQNFIANGKVKMSGNNATMVGPTTEDFYYSPERWFVFYGRDRRPTLTALPVIENEEKGYSFLPHYDFFRYGSTVLTRSGKKAVAYGELFSLITGISDADAGPLHLYDVRLRPKNNTTRFVI